MTPRRALLALAAAPVAARAQGRYPDRLVRLVIPYPPGGTTDIVGRLVAQRLSEMWNQRVVVENRAGAGGSIGTDYVAKSAPDGYTLVLGNSASHGANVLLSANPAYDPLRDFAPISMLAVVRQVLVVRADLGVASVRDLAERARAEPGRLTFASSSVGGAPHLAGEVFKQVARLDLRHIPYNGAAPALNALVAGDVTMLFGSVPTVVELVRAGRLRALAMASATRSELMPDLPTMAEVGFPGVEMDSWFGLLAPAGTPAPILAQLNADLRRAVEGDEMRRRMAELGFERDTGPAADLTALMTREMARMRRLIAEAGIRE